MEKIDLNEYLASNEYPGRGIAVAKAPDGRQMFIGYFIMGRSENSRNRVFDPVPERGGICTMAADPAKLEDPSLIIYNPVLTLGKTHICPGDFYSLEHFAGIIHFRSIFSINKPKLPFFTYLHIAEYHTLFFIFLSEKQICFLSVAVLYLSLTFICS